MDEILRILALLLFLAFIISPFIFLGYMWRRYSWDQFLSHQEKWEDMHREPINYLADRIRSKNRKIGHELTEDNIDDYMVD